VTAAALLLLEIALALQAVTGVADPAQRFAPVPSPPRYLHCARQRSPSVRQSWTRASAAQLLPFSYAFAQKL
jgi:hypothetical protein